MSLVRLIFNAINKIFVFFFGLVMVFLVFCMMVATMCFVVLFGRVFFFVFFRFHILGILLKFIWVQLPIKYSNLNHKYSGFAISLI